MSFEIREPVLDEAEAIRRMHARSWLDTYPNEDEGISYAWVKEETDSWLTPEGLKRSREHFSNVFGNPDHFYRVAVDGDKIIGLVHVLNQNDHKHLGAIYVDKAYHGTGVAQELMALADQWIGDEDVDLDVVTYNKRAMRFYEKHGFKAVEGENELFKGKIPNITMVRKGGK